MDDAAAMKTNQTSATAFIHRLLYHPSFVHSYLRVLGSDSLDEIDRHDLNVAEETIAAAKAANNGKPKFTHSHIILTTANAIISRS